MIRQAQSHIAAHPPHHSAGRLKILEVASGLPGWGGTEIHLLNLGEQLVARGHEVHVACQPGKFVEAEAKKRGLPTVAATCRRQNSWAPIFHYVSLLRKGQYDVVHVHWDNDYKIPGTAARICGVPVVLLSHHSPHPFKRPLNRWLYTKVLYNRLIALSESVRELLLQQGASPEKVTTIHHGIDTKAFRMSAGAGSDLRAEWGVPEEACLVGMAGRIDTEKGVHTFVKAIARCDKKDIFGAFIGDGKSEAAVGQLSKELGISDRVKFAGFRRDVSTAINALDILVLASTWAEPCAAVVEQAMALSKPVIGTAIGGTPELMQDGLTGILVPPGDDLALAEAIKGLAANAVQRANMGAAGRERVDKLFNQEHMVDSIENIYYSEYYAAAGVAGK
jgi:glycosyltransferase involved in cell wall biosynthesis